MSDERIQFVATLSNGDTVAEHSGEYRIIPGERKPWVRLTQFLADNDLHLTSLRLNFRGRTIHLPRANFSRFDFEDKACAPKSYSLQYYGEVEMDERGMSETHFIDLAAHFEDDLAVHYIQDLAKGNNSWVVLSRGDKPLAMTPEA